MIECNALSTRKKRFGRRMLPIVFAFGILILALRWHSIRPYVPSNILSSEYKADEIKLIANPRTPADKIVNGAKMEVKRGVLYDASYASIPYPNGDVPANQGACTDVVIRALRNAGYDLQRLIYEDKSQHPGAYPRYAVRRADRNIDHRRVPNHLAFLRRHGLALPLTVDGNAAATWQPGDLVYWKLPTNQDHCGVLSNDRNADGLPLVIHNMGEARQEDCLTSWGIVGHFRYQASGAR